MPLSIGIGIDAGALGLGGDAALPSGLGYMVDENGADLVDENGAFLIGESAPAYSTIRDAAEARGIKFGVAAPRASLTTAGSLVTQQFSLLGWDGAFKPNNIQDVEGVFTWTSVDDALAYSTANSLPWRLHVLNYPKSDMAWVNGTTVTAGNVYAKVDAHFEAIAAHLATFGANGVPTSIDVTNELAEGSETNGFHRNAWYDAGGREIFAYMFEKARELWPTVPLYLCQDLLEEEVPDYGDRRVSFLKIIDYLQSVGAPVDGVNAQGHLRLNATWDAVAFRNYFDSLRSRGLKILVGEHDVQVDPNLDGPFAADYSIAALDHATAYRSAQYTDIVMPFVTGGEFTMWNLSDTDNPWGADQRPCLYDDSLTVKPAYYRAILEPMLTRR